MSEGEWALEIVKVLVAAATPAIVLIGGFALNERLKRIEHAQWSTQKIVERRIAVYDDLAIPLNELYCYFLYVGTWKELTPPQVVQLKRKLDKTVYTNAPLFDQKFKDLYEKLTGIMFATFGRWGADAKLRTLTDRRKGVGGTAWEAAWDDCFVNPREATEPDEVKLPYGRVMAHLAESIGVQKADENLLGETQTPGNFDTRAAGIVSIRKPSPRADE